MGAVDDAFWGNSQGGIFDKMMSDISSDLTSKTGDALAQASVDKVNAKAAAELAPAEAVDGNAQDRMQEQATLDHQKAVDWGNAQSNAEYGV